jgi:hypothetical protein
MINPDLNWLTVIGATIAAMVLGALWYSPVLFAKEWTELMNLKKGDIDTSKKGMAKTYGMSALVTFVTAFVLKQFIDLFYIVNFFDALQLAFWIWFGFVATSMMNSVIYEKKPWRLYIINAGYQLAILILMSVILSYWP